MPSPAWSRPVGRPPARGRRHNGDRGHHYDRRIGFAHQYRPLLDDELTFVLTRHWRKLGAHLDTGDFADAQAIAAVGRITRGNFRLIQRLFVQIERILRINDLTVITDDVVEAARSTLVIGAT